ncbi:hypothetical protein [Neptuniibacter sp. QD37_11]|uniref:hypothetical protein n=1 Tax=Neptuniibacter sp. QD37_11 TaxID=3398209 RepID=UPI0039F5FA91
MLDIYLNHLTPKDRAKALGFNVEQVWQAKSVDRVHLLSSLDAGTDKHSDSVFVAKDLSKLTVQTHEGYISGTDILECALQAVAQGPEDYLIRTISRELTEEYGQLSLVMNTLRYEDAFCPDVTSPEAARLLRELLHTARIDALEFDINGQTQLILLEDHKMRRTSDHFHIINNALDWEKHPVVHESLDDFNLTFHVDEQQRLFEARRESGDIIAQVYMKEGLTEVADVKIKKAFQGRGIANALYDQIEGFTGKEIIPSENLSYDAYRLWLKRKPHLMRDSLYNYKDLLLGAEIDVNGEKRTIVDVRHEAIGYSTRSGSSFPMSLTELEERGVVSRIPEDSKDSELTPYY